MSKGLLIQMNNHIMNEYIDEPFDVCQDGIQVNGEGIEVCLDNITVNFENKENHEVDENLSIVNGAHCIVTNSKFENGHKLCLIGSGDHPALDMNIVAHFYNCIFQNGSRRFPEGQDGCQIVLQNCTIKNWGLKRYFDVRAFGVWAHKGCHITIKNCKFEQSSFFQTGIFNFFVDLFNHIGQAVNDNGIKEIFKWKNWIPGVCRGAIATDTGTIKIENCTKNKKWIYCEGGADYVKG